MSCEMQVKRVWSTMWILSLFVWNLMWNASEIVWNIMWISIPIHVKTCVKCVWKLMWKCVWKGWHRFTRFSHTFHYIIFHMHVKYACEMWWKTCERCVKRTHLSHIFHAFFHRVFHTHTPGSAMANAVKIKFPSL